MSASPPRCRSRTRTGSSRAACWVTNPRNHPDHIEFLRYEPDSTVPEVDQEQPARRLPRRRARALSHRGPEILIPPFVVGDFLEVGVRLEAQHDLRIHALSEGRLVRQIERNASTTGLPAADSAMSYRRSTPMPGTSPRRAWRARPPRFRGLGLDTVTLAGSYHAGKFLRPHGKHRQGLFPGGRHRLFPRRRRGATARSSRSRTASLAERDVLRELARPAASAVNVWLVLLHNTRLGDGPSGCDASRNAFGDRYVYNLCPSAPAARAYARRPRQDVTESYPVARHFAGVAGLRALCPRLPSRVRADQAEPLVRQSARPLLLRPLREGRGSTPASTRRRSKPRVARRHRVLSRQRYRSSRRHGRGLLARRHAQPTANSAPSSTGAAIVVTSLVAEIRAAVRKDADGRGHPLGGAADRRRRYEGSDLAALAEAAGIIEACFYEPSADAGAGRPLRRQAPAARHGQAARHPAAGASRSRQREASSLAAVAALREAGIDEHRLLQLGASAPRPISTGSARPSQASGD